MIMMVLKCELKVISHAVDNLKTQNINITIAQFLIALVVVWLVKDVSLLILIPVWLMSVYILSHYRCK